MFKIMLMVFMSTVIILGDALVLKTGQTQSYDANGNIVTDGSVKDDGYYQTGAERRYSRNGDIVIDHASGLQWQDNETVSKPWLTSANNNGDYNDTSGDTATTYCNDLIIGVYDDWRLPNIIELQSIIDYTNTNRTINDVFQSSMEEGKYWSSTTISGSETKAWYINYDGAVRFNAKYFDYSIRCVRSALFPNLSFTRQGNTVIDSEGLQWQDDEVVATTTRSWTDAINYCEQLELDTYDNWRLPNVNELFSIVDYTRTDDRNIDSTFQNLNADRYWTSTTSFADSESDTPIIDFTGGNSYHTNKFSYLVSGNHYVRCVRSKQPPIANAGENKTVTVGTSVTLDGSNSSDSDGNIVSYAWKEYSTLLSTDATFSKSDFSVGVHFITLIVTDDTGATSTDVVTLYVHDIGTWEVTVKENYEIGQGKFFSKEFNVWLRNIFPDYTDEEQHNVTIEDIQREYKPEDISINLNNDNIALNCDPVVDGSHIALNCKISGTLDAPQIATLQIEDAKHSFSKSIDIDFTISEYKLENVVDTDAFIILNGDSPNDITHHISIGLDAIYVNATYPTCTFKDINGVDIRMFTKAVVGKDNRYICSTSDYGWFDGVESYIGDMDHVDLYDLVDVAKEGNIEVNISFGDKTHKMNVPVYDRNELTANAVLEYAYEYDGALFGFDDGTPSFLVVNSRVYTMDAVPDKIYLGGTAVEGTNNKDFVYIQGGIWKLSFQGHEMLIKMEKGMGKSNLAFTVDGSDLSENAKIVEFIADPSSTYNMILKKTSGARRLLGVGNEKTFFDNPDLDNPEIEFTECVSENDLQNLEPIRYSLHPCYQYDDSPFHQTFADTTAGVRGTTLQINKDENESAIFNLLEGEVVVSSENMESNLTLTDMTSFDINRTTKSLIVRDTLDTLQKSYLSDTTLNSVDANQSIGQITINTNTSGAVFYLLGKNVQYGYGTDTVFEEVAEGNYTLRFLPISQYNEPQDINISITKDTLDQVFIGTYEKKPNITPIIMYLLN